MCTQDGSHKMGAGVGAHRPLACKSLLTSERVPRGWIVAHGDCTSGACSTRTQLADASSDSAPVTHACTLVTEHACHNTCRHSCSRIRGLIESPRQVDRTHRYENIFKLSGACPPSAFGVLRTVLNVELEDAATRCQCPRSHTPTLNKVATHSRRI